MTLYYVFASIAFHAAPVAMVALLIAISPFFSGVLHFLSSRYFNSREVVGFLFAFVGLIIYFSNKDYSSVGYESSDIILGAGLALLAALVRALFSFLVGEFSKKGIKVNAADMSDKTLFIGAICLLPIFLFSENKSVVFESENILLLGGLALFGTVAPNILNTYASTKINSTLHNIICMATPLLASLFAWLLLGENETWITLLAMLITMVGVMYSALPKKRLS